MNPIRILSFDAVADAVADLCGKAACDLPSDVLKALQSGREKRTRRNRARLFRPVSGKRTHRPRGTDAALSGQIDIRIVELGDAVRLDRGTLTEALTEGTRRGYGEHYLRKSIVNDPLFDRKNTTDNTPPVIHLELVPGDQLRIILAPKGGGSENMSAVRMLKPSDGKTGVVNFVVETVRNAGGNPCPPTIVGVGIGGTMEKAALLAKRALLRPLGQPNPDPRYAALEQEILEKINATGVGPQGLGGDITSLAVHIDFHPCHIASMPVALNLNCHAARHAEVTL